MNINIVSDFATISISSDYDLNLSHLQDFLESLMGDYVEVEDEAEGEVEWEEEEAV